MADIAICIGVVVTVALASANVAWDRWLLHLERLREKPESSEMKCCTGCNGQGTIPCLLCNGTGKLNKVEGKHG